MRAASDVGGTFTDLVYYNTDSEAGGLVAAVKADTTPPNFERGVMNAIDKAALSPSEFDFFAHGSTVVINALTERKGVRTALVTTRGFRDVLEIARGNRPDLFNFNFRKPSPFVDRYLRAEVDERVNFKGVVEREVDLAPLDELVAYFKSEGVQAIAVCLLHAYLEPANEVKVAERIKALWPEVSVLASHEISREWREYERTSSTVLSAYVHPIAKTYIESLEARLSESGFANAPYMMQSNGGISTVEAAKSNPITMVESGPASGIFAAAYMGKVIDEPNLIVLDIGGTTAKCTLIEKSEVKITTEYYIERDGRNPGYPIQTPVSEIVEIGNGGGSIAWVDEGRKLHVGPQSAGAMPGPAAYGKGGDKPTTTDANLVLGRIDPQSFVGGEVEPDWNAVDRAFAPLCDELQLGKEEVARGIVRIANANMTNALRLVSTNKGHDPRDFALMAFGGGGAMHAVSLAEELKVPRVIIPVNSAVFSAWGMLLTDLRRDYIRTAPMSLRDEARDDIDRMFQRLKDDAQTGFAADGVEASADKYSFEYLADMRYEGQEHTVKVPVSWRGDSVDVEGTSQAFHEAHEKRFTYRLDVGVQIVNFHLVGKVLVEKPELQKKARHGLALDACLIGRRKVDFDQHGEHDSAIYDGDRLEPGMTFTGPAVIQEKSVTLVIPPGKRAGIDDYGNYHVEIFPELGAAEG